MQAAFRALCCRILSELAPGTTMKYTQEQLAAIAAKLRDMPPVEKKQPEHSKQEAIKLLKKEIEAMQKRGYTLDQVSEALRGEGLDIATPTLKSYLNRARPGGTKAGGKAKATPAAEPVQRQEVAPAKASFDPKPDSDEI